MSGWIYCYSPACLLGAVLLWKSFPSVRDGAVFLHVQGRSGSPRFREKELCWCCWCGHHKELSPLAGKARPAKSPESKARYMSKITAFWCLYCQDLMMQLFGCLCSWSQGGTTPKCHLCLQTFQCLPFFQFSSPLLSSAQVVSLPCSPNVSTPFSE